MKVKNMENLFKYSLPSFFRGQSRNEILNFIHRKLYGPCCDCLKNEDISLLLQRLHTIGHTMSKHDFCIAYGYCDIENFVEVVAKYMGIGFNSFAFSTQEDVLIRGFYPIFGVFTNEIVASIMLHTYKCEDYIKKSVQEIQDRVDYLGQGVRYFRFFKDVVPVNLKKLLAKKSTSLICVDIPKNRPQYTYAESVLLELSDIYNLCFLPWKDSNEVEYWLSNKKMKKEYESKCTNFSFDSSNVVKYFHNNYYAGLSCLLRKKKMYSVNPKWNSYLDNCLIASLATKNLNEKVDLNVAHDMVHIYKSLIQMGKTVEECDVRRRELGISVEYTASELNYLCENFDMTTEQLEKHKQGFKRSGFSMGAKIMTLENKVNCKLHNLDDAQKKELLSNFK